MHRSLVTAVGTFLMLGVMLGVAEPLQPTPTTTTTPTPPTKPATPVPNVKNSSIILAEDASIQNISMRLGYFLNMFSAYEKRVLVFISNIKKGYLSISTDSDQFLNELEGYINQLPQPKTILVAKQRRTKCYCEGTFHRPCPERCLYSCYAYFPNRGRQSEDNCQNESYSECYCYEGESTRCIEDNVENCIEKTHEKVAVEKPCMQFSTNQSTIEESYQRYSNLLTEPLKKRLRDLKFRLSCFREAVITSNFISNFTAQQLCDPLGDSTCTSEIPILLSEKLKYYRILKTNITFDMLKIQEESEIVAKKVNFLREQVFGNLNELIKGYSCCLKGLNFTMSGYECDYPKPEISSTTTMTPTWRISRTRCLGFRCENMMCVSPLSRCDGILDCADGSDENDCSTVDE